jgi:hypothetical protein
VGRVVPCVVDHGHNVAWGARGGLMKMHMTRQHRGRVAQLAESGHAPGWGSSQAQQPGSIGQDDRLLGFKPG